MACPESRGSAAAAVLFPAPLVLHVAFPTRRRLVTVHRPAAQLRIGHLKFPGSVTCFRGAARDVRRPDLGDSRSLSRWSPATTATGTSGSLGVPRPGRRSVGGAGRGWPPRAPLPASCSAPWPPEWRRRSAAPA